MSPPRQPTPDRSTPVNHGILSPRVVALRGRIDELIRGTLQLAEKLPTTNGELFPHSRDYESVAPHRLLIAGIRPGDTSRLLNALKAQPISNATKDDPNAMHQAKNHLRHVSFIEAHDNHPLADSTHEAEFIFFAIPAEDPSHEPSWNHLSTWQESELEKLSLVADALPSNAASKVCHGNMAHLMRAGNFRRPESAARSPSSGGGSDDAPSNMSRTRDDRDFASATVRPWVLPVIIEAEAREMAQPWPWKATSERVAPSIWTKTFTSSPHSGLCPSAAQKQPSIARKFRGRLLWSRMISW